MTLQELLDSVRQRVMGGPGGVFGEAGRRAYGDVRMIDSRRVLLYLYACAGVCSVAACGAGWVARGLWLSLNGW